MVEMSGRENGMKERKSIVAALPRLTRYVTFASVQTQCRIVLPGSLVGATLSDLNSKLMYITFWLIPKKKASHGSNYLCSRLGLPSHQKNKEKKWCWEIYKKNQRSGRREKSLFQRLN